jgi:hypothetical protein
MEINEENKQYKTKRENENNDSKIINCLIHLTFMNDMVSQINKYKLNILKDIYKKYFLTSNLTYNEFKNNIFKKKRPNFIKKT